MQYFGACADGSRDDTAAIQRAYNACRASGGGYVHFPPGFYRMGTLSIPPIVTNPAAIDNTVSFRFGGIGSTVLTPNAPNIPLFNVSQTGGLVAVGVRFEGGFTIQAHPNGSTGPGIDLTGARQFMLEAISYWDSGRGRVGSPGTYAQAIGLGINTYACHITDAVCESQTLSKSFIGAINNATVVANNNVIENCLIEACTFTYAIDGGGTEELNIYDGIIEGNTCTAAIRLGKLTRVRGIHFELNNSFDMSAHGVDRTDPGKCWLENNYYHSVTDLLTIPVSTLGDNWFINNAGTSAAGTLNIVDNTNSTNVLSNDVVNVNGLGVFSTLNSSLAVQKIVAMPVTETTTSGTLSGWNGSLSQHQVTLTGNLTVGAASGGQRDGDFVYWKFNQAPAGGPFTVAFGAQFQLASAFTMSPTASGVAGIGFVWDQAHLKWLETWRTAQI